jgi:hypothetical protein
MVVRIHAGEPILILSRTCRSGDLRSVDEPPDLISFLAAQVNEVRKASTGMAENFPDPDDPLASR